MTPGPNLIYCTRMSCQFRFSLIDLLVAASKSAREICDDDQFLSLALPKVFAKSFWKKSSADQLAKPARSQQRQTMKGTNQESEER